MKNKLIVALDLERVEECDRWFKRVKGHVAGVKIGLQLYTLGGPQLLEKAAAENLAVFLDLKFHDIPNTVKSAAKAAADLNVWMLTVHCSGGAKMLEAAREGIDATSGKGSTKPKLLGVTVLTSEEAASGEVVRRAELAKKHGCDGVVASAWEIQAIRKACGTDFLIVTPGIRLDKNSKDDQKRVATPKEALDWGADYLVVGRPILQAADPEKVLRELSKIQ